MTTPVGNLAIEFGRIRDAHGEATLHVIARGAFPPSVSRAFASGTKQVVVAILSSLPVDELPSVEDRFAAWFESHLDDLSGGILRLNPNRRDSRIHPGYKWGHAAKVLAIYLRDLLMFSRHFSQPEVDRIARWLYCPVDSYVLDRLRAVGFDPGVARIKDIDTRAKFHHIQDHLEQGARNAHVPRVWFDDVSIARNSVAADQ